MSRLKTHKEAEKMKLNELSPAVGSAKDAYRRGRGPGSGNGKTAGKGHKGQNARSGGGEIGRASCRERV